MTNKEILQKAIEKAKDNGWEDIEKISTIQVDEHVFLLKSYAPSHIFFDIKEVLFDHDFAKAFWGQKIAGNCMCNGTSSLQRHSSKCFRPEYKDLGWKYHLQQMVLEEEPLKYLEKFL